MAYTHTLYMYMNTSCAEQTKQMVGTVVNDTPLPPQDILTYMYIVYVREDMIHVHVVLHSPGPILFP